MPSKKTDEKSKGIDDAIYKFKDLPKNDKLELISYFIDELKNDFANQDNFGKKEISIPAGVFSNDALSSLEAIVKYLRENAELRFSNISKLLNRSNKTIWATYHNANKKMPSSFGKVSRDFIMPVSVFADRSFSTLECVVKFLKDHGCTNHEVALMLHLDDRTIWTVYDKVKKKRGMKS